MSDEKIATAKGLCIIALTKYLMQYFEISQDEAFEKLLGMELYELVMDTETRLFLETNDSLCELCEKELAEGKEALYQTLSENIFV